MLFGLLNKKEAWTQKFLDTRIGNKNFYEWLADLEFDKYKHDLEYRRQLSKALHLEKPYDLDYKFLLKKGTMKNVYDEMFHLSR